MNTFLILGRIIFGAYILYSGINHFITLRSTASFVYQKHVPWPAFATMVSGGLLILGGLSILTWIFVPLGVFALIVFFIPVTVLIHNFWTIKDPAKRSVEMHKFMGNLMITGLLFILLGLVS